jgi:hypothetical protein
MLEKFLSCFVMFLRVSFYFDFIVFNRSSKVGLFINLLFNFKNHHNFMNKKIFSIITLALMLILGAGALGITTVSAQAVPSFPAGCGSAIGYSVTTGMPCNGTTSSPLQYIPGCSNAVIGYSTINGIPCDGTTVAIPYINGCTSTLGYSTTIQGQACNGSQVATLTVTYPTFPITGSGGSAASTITLLISLGILAVGGLVYIRQKSVSKA